MSIVPDFRKLLTLITLLIVYYLIFSLLLSIIIGIQSLVSNNKIATLMKDRIILTQERQTSDTCIKISSLDCNLLVDFLIKEKVAFSIIPCGQESDSSIHEEELAEGSNQILSDTEQFLETVYLKYILKNSASTPSIEKISEEAGWTQSIFKSRFKAYYGKPFYQAYMEKKMKYAAELLNKSWKAADVSEEVGYAQPIKFNKMFQKHFGITPKKFQKKYKLSGFK